MENEEKERLRKRGKLNRKVTNRNKRIDSEKSE